MLFRISLVLLAVTAASPLPGQYTEDRDNRTPVSARYWYYNATTATLSSIAASNRIVDIEVTQTSPSTRFTVSYLKNTGGFAKTWWYFYGWTSTALASSLSSRKARLTDLEVYNTSSGLRFSGLMEANATNGKSWWWYYNSSVAGIMAQASSNGARVVDIEQYAIGSSTYYAAILLKNTGKDAKAWWMHVNVTSSTVQALLATNKARIWDLDRRADGRYNVVMTRWSGEQSWNWYGRTASQVNTIVHQYGARIIDVDQYDSGSGTRFNVVMLNAADALTAKVRDMMLARTNGSMGAHLRRIPSTSSSYTVAGFNASARYEPASTLKTLHHIVTMRQVYLFQRNLGSNLSNKYYTPSGSCPQTRAPVLQTLEVLLRGMMENSNNSYTKVIKDLQGGHTGLTNHANALNMFNTALSRDMGCPPLTNYSTLTDLGILHEKVIKGYLGSQRSKFYSLMINGVSTSLRNVINQEAASLSMTSSQANSFVANMEIGGKGGNDTVGAVNNWSWYTYIKLPCWENGGMTQREYSTGAWVNNSTSAANAENAVNVGSSEILRNEIRACLLTMKNHVSGTFSTYGSSCGGKYSPLTHDATGTPQLGQKVYYRLNGSRRGSHLTSLKVGLSKTVWGGIQLPLHLSFLGAAGCYWRTDSLIEAFLTASNGKAAIPATIPFDKSLINIRVHTQFLSAEPGANAAGLTATNGITTKIGGQK